MFSYKIPLSLYIHMPWCVQKCPYCDFNSHTIKKTPDYRAYIDHLIKDLQQDIALCPERSIHSIFIGGGTPSLFSAELIDHLLTKINELIPIEKQAEITIEANPNSVDAERFTGYQQAGINRISIGVQSFQTDKLIRLGRVHNPQEAINAGKLAHKLKLDSFNLDLMHGLPNQSLDDALFDLKQAIAINPPHLSWYQLTIEPNTLFGSKPPVLPDDDKLWEIYQIGHQLLTQHGYQQYETSAYAKPELKCQHNLNYWRFGDYLGIGCGAHGKITQPNGDIIRTVKTRHPKGYLEGRYIEKSYTVPKEDLAFEFFMNRFRLFEATPKIEFEQRTFLPLQTIDRQINLAIEKNYLTEDKEYWKITEQGKLFLNSLLEIFL
ncbi:MULTISPECIES: radical SAM family heme chaperone HemW [unclassified Gilliamella]|uniref:radical SAM family heme chaperone HemW n=1 Tax=unclassified Gilliamella TaxID=2685620 RepID=UPI002269AA83|nr:MULTISPECIES: radical SAM family heme chaperone HemW [unclassified Gilliamella]MCX8573952.1 radical SAM family heme chaperone HemW [Gilliamella sp. B3831]MCX8576183.1 radical SAM family heme chaperone HemW [Gilliamella sp. B3815]MCX8603284.1 radical SAM family heme chaperone HemW [Gilliamella sp. B3823]MCX8607099.1 radical SAM family heme chaperone HemW [Gilliamella sp. B3825]MCX8636617.1 radical SAM family heme chaperone HemW [Gilliamella sp. B3817]